MAVTNPNPWAWTEHGTTSYFVYAEISCDCTSKTVTVEITNTTGLWRIKGSASQGDTNTYLEGSTTGTFTFKGTTSGKKYVLQGYDYFADTYFNTGMDYVSGDSIFSVDFNHSYVLSSTVNASCTSSGYKTYTCSSCGDWYEENIPALGHKESTSTVAPTCTAQGYTKRYCTRCNAVLEKTNYTAALGHNYANPTEIKPTCTEQGYTRYTCSKCGGTKNENVVNPLGHLWNDGEIVIEPTHTTEGTMKYTCLRDGCGATNMVVIAKKTGSVRMSNGTTYDTYSIYIYDGSVWHVYAPYIFNGTSWEAYS